MENTRVHCKHIFVSSCVMHAGMVFLKVWNFSQHYPMLRYYRLEFCIILIRNYSGLHLLHCLLVSHNTFIYNSLFKVTPVFNDILGWLWGHHGNNREQLSLNQQLISNLEVEQICALTTRERIDASWVYIRSENEVYCFCFINSVVCGVTFNTFKVQSHTVEHVQSHPHNIF